MSCVKTWPYSTQLWGRSSRLPEHVGRLPDPESQRYIDIYTEDAKMWVRRGALHRLKHSVSCPAVGAHANSDVLWRKYGTLHRGSLLM